MSRAGTPTDNAAMEAINGWIKAEIFNDFHLTGTGNIRDEVEAPSVSSKVFRNRKKALQPAS